jgi:hypothetical protein
LRRVVSLQETDISEVRTASIIRVIILMMEAVRTSETSVYSNETARRYIPEGSHPQNYVCLCDPIKAAGSAAIFFQQLYLFSSYIFQQLYLFSSYICSVSIFFSSSICSAAVSVQ